MFSNRLGPVFLKRSDGFGNVQNPVKFIFSFNISEQKLYGKFYFLDLIYIDCLQQFFRLGSDLIFEGRIQNRFFFLEVGS